MFCRLGLTGRILHNSDIGKTVLQGHRNIALTHRVAFNNKLIHTTSRLLSKEASEVETVNELNKASVKSEDTFASLLRHSAFMQIGNPVGKVVNSAGFLYEV